MELKESNFVLATEISLVSSIAEKMVTWISLNSGFGGGISSVGSRKKNLGVESRAEAMDRMSEDICYFADSKSQIDLYRLLTEFGNGSANQI